PVLRGRACFYELDDLRRRRDFLEIVDRLIVCGKLVISARTEPEHRVGRWEAITGTAQHDGRRQREAERQLDEEMSHTASISQRPFFGRRRRPRPSFISAIRAKASSCNVRICVPSRSSITCICVLSRSFVAPIWEVSRSSIAPIWKVSRSSIACICVL